MFDKILYTRLDLYHNGEQICGFLGHSVKGNSLQFLEMFHLKRFFNSLFNQCLLLSTRMLKLGFSSGFEKGTAFKHNEIIDKIDIMTKKHI